MTNNAGTNRYSMLILFSLFFVALLFTAKETAFLILLFPIGLRLQHGMVRNRFLIGVLCAVINSLWYVLFQPPTMTTRDWLVSSILFLCMGIGLSYIDHIKQTSILNAAQNTNLSDEVHQLQMQLQAFKVALPDRAFIYDEDGYYVDVISQLIAPEQQQYLIGKHISATPEILTKETALKMLEVIQKTIKTGESQQIEYLAFTSREQGWKWLQGRTAVISQTTSKKATVLWVARDVTRQRELFDNLQKVQKLAHIGTWETDVPNNYVTWSDEMYRIYDITPEEFKYTTEDVTSRFHPDDLVEFREKLDQGINPYPTEYRIIRPDKSVRTVFAVGESIYDEHGRLIRRIGLLQDITDRKQSEQERFKLQIEQQRTTTLRNLITNVTHDIMTPLTSAKTEAYILSKISDKDKRQAHINILQMQIDRLQKIFEDMLLVSYLNNIQLDNLSPKTTNILYILQILEHQYRVLLSAKNQHFEVDLPDTRILLHIDEEHVQRAIGCLLENAMQYTPEGGHISLSLTDNDSHLTITVADDGIGISPDQQKLIFDRFYRSEEHRPATGNSGLGLSIAQLIIELHGGEIRVESSLGEGSQFHVILPKI